MKNQTIQHAVMCLQVLEDAPPQGLTSKAISRELGIPFNTCRFILGRLEAAGMITAVSEDAYCLEQALEEVKALELIAAILAPEPHMPAFQMLFGPARGFGLQPTLQAAGRLAMPMDFAQG